MTTTTHETYLESVAAIVIAAAELTDDERQALNEIKLVYGAGATGLRGITYFSRWNGNHGSTESVPFVEICAFGEEHWIQLAGTTIHELSHVLAGPMAGHSKDWRTSCERLGLRKAKAAGHSYMLASLRPDIRDAIARLPRPDEGEPVKWFAGGAGGNLKPCPAGHGTRGGKSRGKGSGSRLKLWECDCNPPVKVRVARADFHAHCDDCNGAFKQP